MHITGQKEQFSLAYFHAVAAATGLKLFHSQVDDESVDVTVGRTGSGGTIRSLRLDVQLKCSSRGLLKADGIHLKLSRKNYDDLREVDLHTKRILVVLLVPDTPDEWCVNTAETQLCLRQNAWWMSLEGTDEKAGVKEPTVILPRSQIFDPKALSDIMNRIAREECL